MNNDHVPQTDLKYTIKRKTSFNTEFSKYLAIIIPKHINVSITATYSTEFKKRNTGLALILGW